jgi:GcrA cell cycle regulator
MGIPPGARQSEAEQGEEMKLWTDDKVEQLRALLESGKLSAAQVAHLLGDGFTRNAVIGKARRMRIEMTPKVKAPRRHPFKPRGSVLPIAVAEAAVVRVEAPTAAPARCSFHELDDLPEAPRKCRWPEGASAPYLFCGGRTVEGLSYCGYHRSRSVSNAPVKGRPYAVGSGR